MRANSNGQPIYILHATDDEILNKQNALMEIKKTMAQQDRQDPDAAKHRIIDAFAQLGVSVEALKEFVGHELSALTPNEIQLLRTTYTSIKDGETSWKAVMDDKAENEANAKENAQPTVTDAEVVEDSETEPEDSDMFA